MDQQERSRALTDPVLLSTKGAVGIIELNRPKHLNALNTAVAKAIIDAAREFDQNPKIGCIVVTGSEKAFAAGADILEMENLSATDMREQSFFAEWDEFTAFETPKIAAVRGYALGGGCELMMMCDFAIAGQGAKFGQPEVKLGVIAGMGGSQRMTKLIGRALSMDMHLTGRMMGADEALRSGLVARVVPDEQVLETALDAAQLIASYSRPAIRTARTAVHHGENLPLPDGIAHERHVFYELFGTPDQAEGMQAFLQKRVPEFLSE